MKVWLSPVPSGNRPAFSVSTIGLGVAVDGIRAIDLQDFVAARELRWRRACPARCMPRRCGAAASGREHGELRAVAGLDSALRQRHPVVGVVGEVELVLVLAGGGGRGGLQQIEVRACVVYSDGSRSVTSPYQRYSSLVQDRSQLFSSVRGSLAIGGAGARDRRTWRRRWWTAGTRRPARS